MLLISFYVISWSLGVYSDNKGLLEPQEVEEAIRCPVDEVEIIHHQKKILFSKMPCQLTGLGLYAPVGPIIGGTKNS